MMRPIVLSLVAALACPLSTQAQSFEQRDWQVVCDNTRTCRAAGYSVEGSDNPVSVLFARASGPGRPVFGELQLGTLDARAVYPASVALTIAGKAAGTIRIDRDNHAALAPAIAAAMLKAFVGGADVAFVSGKTTWRLSGDGAAAVLQQIDEVQGRVGTLSALVRKGRAGDSDVASPMSLPRFEAVRVPAAAQPGDDALVVRVLASIQSSADCPLLDDGAAQARARLWHLDANRLLVSQSCRAVADGAAQGYWLANRRPPYDAKPLALSAGDFDGVTSIKEHLAGGPANDCGSARSWTWNGFRFEQTDVATGGLCRGVKAGGAWALPSVVTDVIPAN